jgi:galactonate dehydratase
VKITNIEIETVHVTERADWTFVHINTDQDIRGLGELNPSVRRADALGTLRTMAEQLIGRDPRQIERINALFDPQALDRFGFRALSALDQALWDILGKSLGAPVYQLLGGLCRDEIRLYANINRATRTDRSPEAFARNAAAAVADGFDAVKLAPFDGMARGIDKAEDAEDGLACMRAVRAAIGPNVDLLIDCHSHFTARGALAVADALFELDLFWFEEPVPDTDIEGYLEVKARSGLPVAGGESRLHRRGFWEIFDRGGLDIAMPDVTVVGGLSELSKVAAMAETRDILTAPHGPFGPVTTAASAHAMAAHPAFLILEYAWGEASWRHDLVLPTETINKGRIALSDAPGLGVELNPDTVAAHRIEIS